METNVWGLQMQPVAEQILMRAAWKQGDDEWLPGLCLLVVHYSIIKRQDVKGLLGVMQHT